MITSIATKTQKMTLEIQNKNTQHEELDLRLKNTAEEFFKTLFGSKADFLESWDARAYENGEFISLSLLKYEEYPLQAEANDNTKSFIEETNIT